MVDKTTKALVYELINASWYCGNLEADERPDSELKTRQEEARKKMSDLTDEIIKRV